MPKAPPRPSYISSTALTVKLLLPRCTDDGGSPIISYNLWVDAGDDFSSGFRKVPSYNGQDLEFNSIVTDSLYTGVVYRFKTSATNEYGDSDFSYEVIVGVGANPPKPSPVERDPEF